MAKLKEAELRLISESMMLSGFSGKITKETAQHKPNMKAMAQSARRCGAQIPKSQRKLCELEISSRLSGALRMAGAMDLTVEKFCQRFPPEVLRKYRNFNRNTLVELEKVLAPLAANPVVGAWLESRT